MDLCEQSPSYVRAIAPYQPGKPISELAREMGLKEKSIIKLASNENPLGVSPKAKAAIKKAIAELGRYPDGNAFELKAALAKRYQVPEDCIVVGNGSNDLLEMAAGVFLSPGCSAVYSQHAFAVYPLATQARGARSIVVPAKNYGHDLEAMLAAIAPDTRVVFIANPNNPTGTFVPGAELEDFLERVPREVAVVVDEAYTDYLPRELRYDSVAWLKKYPNFILTRTFSKIYGLAGLRVGFGLMQPAVADLLNRVRQPFNVNSLALAAAAAALGDKAFVAKSTRMNRAGMAKLERALKTLGLETIPSCANFITFRVSSAGMVYEKLLRQGVIVRPLAGYEMPDHLRVTVGTPKENETFLKALRAVLDDD
jgi:histidinol-phosphate aminotransferase